MREIQGRLQHKASLEKQRDEYRADLDKIDVELKVLAFYIGLLSLSMRAVCAFRFPPCI